MHENVKGEDEAINPDAAKWDTLKDVPEPVSRQLEEQQQHANVNEITNTPIMSDEEAANWYQTNFGDGTETQQKYHELQNSPDMLELNRRLRGDGTVSSEVREVTDIDSKGTAADSV